MLCFISHLSIYLVTLIDLKHDIKRATGVNKIRLPRSVPFLLADLVTLRTPVNWIDTDAHGKNTLEHVAAG